MQESPTPIVINTEWRQRSVKGLGFPNLPRLYTQEQRNNRRYLINSLRAATNANPHEEGEPGVPLWHFLGAEAHARIDAKRPTLEGRRFWEHFAHGAFPADDPTAASIPGLQAKHVFEARLSRLALLHTLEDIAAESITDYERGGGEWDGMEFVPAIYPYSARAWEPFTMVQHTVAVASALSLRLQRGDVHSFSCVAERMVFQFAVELHTSYLESLGIEAPPRGLDEALLDNSDFLLLFDPAWDGIENDDAADHADLDISGPLSWFGKEVFEQTMSEMTCESP